MVDILIENPSEDMGFIARGVYHPFFRAEALAGLPLRNGPDDGQTLYGTIHDLTPAPPSATFRPVECQAFG
jgi:hypothetical protein